MKQTDIRKLNDQCTFALLPWVDGFFAADALLYGNEEQQMRLEKVYGRKRVSVLHGKYRFLSEALYAARICGGISGLEVFEFFLDLPVNNTDEKKLLQYILSLPDEERIYRMAGWGFHGITKARIKKALHDDSALSDLYGIVHTRAISEKTLTEQVSFLGFCAFLKDNRRVVKEFFALAKELDDDCLQREYSRFSGKAESLFNEINDALQSMTPLAVSERLMGKTFRNRGPYEEFIFLPALIPHMKALRFFDEKGTHKRQLLFLTLSENESGHNADPVNILKAVADASRYSILKLLVQGEPMRGQDIAKKLQLAPSTVTHHIEQLKSAGLLTEEPSGNAKFFGIRKEGVQAFLEIIKKDLTDL